MLTEKRRPVTSPAQKLPPHTLIPAGLTAALTLLVSLAAVFVLPAHAQSPLILQPSTGRVGIGTSEFPLEFTGGISRFKVEGNVLSSNNGGGPTAVSMTNGTSQWVLYDAPASGGGFYSNNGLEIWEYQSGGCGGSHCAARMIFYPTFPSGTSKLYIPGNVGIGTTNPTYTLHVVGSVSAEVKAFEIRHPLDPDRKVLTHTSLEGPEIGVYYRGEAQLAQGVAEVTLPAYFESLTRKANRTVLLTPVGGWSPLYVEAEVQGGKFTVRTAAGGNPSQRFYWEVKAVRADVAPVAVEKTKAREVIQLPTGSQLR